jgi:glycosyltransferase involved in cell wall biosynthesis
LLYRRADALVAVSTGVADDLVATLRLPRDMITVIYNPIPVTDIRRLAESPTAHPWLARGEPPVILGVGRLTKQKDFSSLIRAFARVRQQRPVRLIILGDGELRGELEALARSLGVAADVTLPGFVDNPFPWMKGAAVFALSSAWEGFGNALIEAMACGTPVIATDCTTGPAELLDDGRYGPLVPVGNDQALADAVCEMLDRPKAAALLAARADVFAAPIALQKFEKLLRSTASDEAAEAPAARILIATPGGVDGNGGISRMVRYFTREMAQDRSFEFKILDPYGTAGRPGKPFLFLRASILLSLDCALRRVDLVHIHMAAHGSVPRKLILLRLAILFGVPVALHVHGAEFDAFYRGLPGWLQAAVRRSMRKATVVIALGEYWRNFLIETGCCDPACIQVLRNAVPGPAQLAPRIGGPARKLLFLGLLGERKGIADLLTALAAPPVRRLDWQLDVAGNGPVEHYRHAAAALGLGDRVRFLGWTGETETHRLLAASDILVLPSHHEGLPVAVLEAMSHGLAIVTTPVGAIPEVISDHWNGLLVPARDPASLATALAEVMQDERLRMELMRNARQTYLQTFDISLFASSLATLYRRLAIPRTPSRRSA